MFLNEMMFKQPKFFLDKDAYISDFSFSKSSSRVSSWKDERHCEIMSLANILTKISFVLMATLIGLVTGGILGGRVFTPRGAMGWDALANAMGGAFIGGALGLLISFALARTLRVGQLKKASAAVFVILVLEIGLLFVAKQLQVW